jgi:hypothetical protein
MLDDVIVAVALVMTVMFGYEAYFGSDGAAAWFALGLAIAGLLRLATIVFEFGEDL